MFSNLAAQRIQSGAMQTLQQLDPRKQTVQNYLGNIKFRCTVEKPSSLEELVAVMVKAKKEKKKVRAVGAFHAWS
jgi:predicted solute-binding protein